MVSLIKLILVIYIVLTSTKVFALKPDKLDLNKPDLNIPDSDPNGDGISILTVIILQLSFYIFVRYLDYRLSKNYKETDVDKVDGNNMEEQHVNNIEN